MFHWLSTRTIAIATTAIIVGIWFGAPTIRGAAFGRLDGPAQGSNVRRSVWDGVYTEIQAKRGKDAYEYSCARCHLQDLEGDPARDVPALSGEQFLGAWSKRTVKDLFDFMGKSMPADEPASLRAQAYIDIVAYLLWTNEFPAGDEELRADVPSLDRINIGIASSRTQEVK